MIEVQELSKRFGDKVAVDNLSFKVEPGRVTGFLGPNGAGKSTTMRMMLGLDHPSAGCVTINGRPYRDLESPLHEVGALIDAKAVQGGRSAYEHLQWVATASGIPRCRVDDVLDIVGLSDVANKKAGGFSLGMSQRLGIATALLGDPNVLLFDEPVNGLDPEGIRWIRTLLKQLAAEGRTVFLSSHLMSEMEETADHVIVIGRGRLVADMSIAEFIRVHGGESVRVVTPQAGDFESVLETAGARVEREPDGALIVTDLDAGRIGDLAGAHGIRLSELAPRRVSLEAAYMELTRDAVEYQSQIAKEN
ncbi:MAG: ABC transporter ATP-binding protein [Hyphomicrobiales bacterium]